MSFASAIGSAIGKSAAYAGHGAIRAGQMTGQFGADLYNGVVDGYTSKAAELSAARAAARAQTPLQVTVARKAEAITD